MLGYEPGELLERTTVNSTLMIRQLRESGPRTGCGRETVPSRYEVKFQRKDGSCFEVRSTQKAIRFDGEPGVQVWVRDISQQKRAQEQLRESEEKLRSMIENLHDAFLPNRYERDTALPVSVFGESRRIHAEEGVGAT